MIIIKKINREINFIFKVDKFGYSYLDLYLAVCEDKIASTLFRKEQPTKGVEGGPINLSRFKIKTTVGCIPVLKWPSLIYTADPRRWSREDVTRWLQWTSEMFNLGSVRPDRFQMNGKALCLMTMDMFLYRVPEGGNILYQDFQRRLRNAVAMQN